MSYLARYLLHEGHSVTGADAADSAVIEQLRALGITIFKGHDASQLPTDTDLVLASPAVIIANPPDVRAAKERGIPVETWQTYLGDLTAKLQTIAVCGVHGKSTTTAMLGQTMQELQLDPTVMVGTLVPAFGNTNLRLGNSPWLVLEADEYHENFLAYTPAHILCTTFEPDHLDYYKTAERYEQAFVDFFAKLPVDGRVFYHAEHTKIGELVRRAGKQGHPVEATPISLQIPGAHNRENAQLVRAFLEYIGQERASIEAALQHFGGTWRRQERVGMTAEGAIVFDDYAHHPTEIRATLAALREAYPAAEILAVFQPHQFSRTRIFLDDFAAAFDVADQVYVMDIYESRDTEEDKKAVSSADLVERLQKRGIRAQAAGDVVATEALLRSLPAASKERVIACMGAGTITKIARSLISA